MYGRDDVCSGKFQRRWQENIGLKKGMIVLEGVNHAGKIFF